ncbi:MAG: hypothetical protein P4M14_01935 [Gammaproteobacteria bacterium]|nr:hypothetical protein [Gammaproteobacteria bacterium]
MVADIPIHQETPSQIQAEWKFVGDNNLAAIKRGIFIDKLSLSNDPKVIQNFLKMYSETQIPEIKEKLIQGTLAYYQGHRKEIKVNGDEIALQKFYAKLLYVKLNKNESDIVLRGYVDLSPTDLILSNKKQIDLLLEKGEVNSVLSLKLALAMKSAELERIYIPLIIDMLKKNRNRADLDSTFFWVMKNNGYQHLRSDTSRLEVKSYLEFSKSKYSIENNSDDINFMFAKKYFEDLKTIFRN